MTRRPAAVAGFALVAALFVSLVFPPPAAACSCAEASLRDIINRHPDAAVGVIRRIDRDGGANGVGLVEHILHGSLPEQVPLALDDGASCRPFVGMGQVATLSFQPINGSWRTIDCGMLDTGTTFSAAFGAIEPDPEARGDPAVALAGGMPGAGVVLLDGDLAVLAVADLTDVMSVDACGDGLLVTASHGNQTVVSLLSVPELEAVHEPVTLGSRRRYERIIDVRCPRDGSVSAVVAAEGRRITLKLYRDLFGGRARKLPPADDAAFSGEELLLLRGDNDGRRSTLAAHDLATGHTVHRRTFNGMAASTLDASPDGRHVVLRGYAEQPVVMVLDAATGALVGRAVGSWMPPENDAWVDNERLLLIDEDLPMGEAGTGPRLVDLRLAEVGRLAPLTPSRLVPGRGVVAAVGGAELTIAAAGQQPRSSGDVRTAAAGDVALLGPVSGGATAVELPEPDPGVEPAGAPSWILIAAITALAAVAALGWRVVRTRRGGSG